MTDITLGYQISIGVLLHCRVSLRLRCNVLRYPLTNGGLIAWIAGLGLQRKPEYRAGLCAWVQLAFDCAGVQRQKLGERGGGGLQALRRLAVGAHPRTWTRRGEATTTGGGWWGGVGPAAILTAAELRSVASSSWL